MLLLTLSIVSLVVAAGFAALAWYVVREDRQRSAVRVAALASAALDTTAASVVVPAAAAATIPTRLGVGRPAAMRGHPLVKVAVGFAMSVGLIVFIAMSADRHEARGGPGGGVGGGPGGAG